MKTRRSGLSIKRVAVALAVLFLLGVTCVLPFVAGDHEYGDVAIPGSATVHLPAGEVDVVLCSRRPTSDADAVAVPPLSIDISGPAGTARPDLVATARAKSGGQGCDVRTQAWVLRVEREADYRVTVDGEVYGPYDPTLSFGRYVWNDFTLALLALGCDIAHLAVIVAAVFVLPSIVAVLAGFLFVGLIWLCKRVLGQSDEPVDDAPPAELPPLPPVSEVCDWPPRDVVYPYPKPPGGLATFFFALIVALLVGGPLCGIYVWFQMPGPVSWGAVMAFGGLATLFAWLFGRLTARWALIRRRRSYGDGWLRLSGNGFEVHGRSGKPKRYAWADIDRFKLVESIDGEGGGVIQSVVVQFASEPRRADRTIHGYWEGPLEDSVDQFKEWLMRHRAAHTLGICESCEENRCGASDPFPDDHDREHHARTSSTAT